VHRDLSPDNILTDWQNQRICITDFGQARQVEPLTHIDFCRDQCHDALTSNTKLAKIHYRPPEGISYYNAQFNGPDSRPQSYHDYSWDMWQLGMVFLYLITSKDRKHPLAYLANDYKILQGKPVSFSSKSIAPDAYMAKVIEDHFGMPTRSEIRDLSFHYPIKSDTDFDFDRIIKELTSFNSDNKPYYLPKKDGEYQQLNEIFFSKSLDWIRGHTSFFPDRLLKYYHPSCFPDASRIKERQFKQEFVAPYVYQKSGCKKELVKRLTHFFKLEEAFQISHKQVHYKKVMNLTDKKHIDQYRLALIRSRENTEHAHSLQFIKKDSEFIYKAQEVIVSLLRFSPTSRATASELLDSEFFAGENSIPKSARDVMKTVLNSKNTDSNMNPLTTFEYHPNMTNFEQFITQFVNHQAYVRKFFERKILDNEYDDAKFKISIFHIVKKYLNQFDAIKPYSDISRMLREINDSLDKELTNMKQRSKFTVRVVGRGKNNTKFKLSQNAVLVFTCSNYIISVEEWSKTVYYQRKETP